MEDPGAEFMLIVPRSQSQDSNSNSLDVKAQVYTAHPLYQGKGKPFLASVIVEQAIKQPWPESLLCVSDTCMSVVVLPLGFLDIPRYLEIQYLHSWCSVIHECQTPTLWR